MLGMEQRYYQILTHIHSILMNQDFEYVEFF
jgi:hypothetical protein